MRAKFKAFPAVYFNTVCTEHNCKVHIYVEASKNYGSIDVIGGQITTQRCEQGGPPTEAPCTAMWEVIISAPGDIIITQT
jgi:hypothetical protein